MADTGLSATDRQRISDALARWDTRFARYPDGAPDHGLVLTAAVDWLRAECKLVDRLLDDGHTGWAEEFLAEAALTVYGIASRLADRIREEGNRA